MKRWLVWSFLSVGTFLVGISLAYAFLSLTAPAHTEERVLPPVAEELALETDAPVQDDFDAEIIGIDYAELELEREHDYDFTDIIESGTLETSIFFEDIRRGEKKFVMFGKSGTYQIRRSPAIFTLKRIKNADYSLLTISFAVPGDPAFILPDLPFLKNGVIRTLYVRPTQSEIDRRGLPIGHSLWRNEKRQFALDQQYYTLWATKGLGSDGRKLDILILENAYEYQVIDASAYYGEGSDESFADVLWAGDLDRDGKLDLIINGTQGLMLYVSSQARPGRMVKLVSTAGLQGC